MNIRFTIGGKYTHAVIDFPVPIVEWFWENLKNKWDQKYKKKHELEKIIAAREAFELAAKLQADISAECSEKFVDYQTSGASGANGTNGKRNGRKNII